MSVPGIVQKCTMILLKLNWIRLQCTSFLFGGLPIDPLTALPGSDCTRQTLRFTKELGRFSNLRAAAVLGGDSMEGQFSALHEKPDIIIATPGR